MTREAMTPEEIYIRERRFKRLRLVLMVVIGVAVALAIVDKLSR